MSSKICIFCGGKADLLCDSHLGWERKRGEIEQNAPNLKFISSGAVPLRYRVIHTCDAPICRACAVPQGMMHVRMKHAAFSDSIDYCPGHGFGDLRTEITGLKAQALRKQWRDSVKARQGAGIANQVDLFDGAPA